MYNLFRVKIAYNNIKPARSKTIIRVILQDQRFLFLYFRRNVVYTMRIHTLYFILYSPCSYSRNIFVICYIILLYNNIYIQEFVTTHNVLHNIIIYISYILCEIGFFFSTLATIFSQNPGGGRAQYPVCLLACLSPDKDDRRIPPRRDHVVTIKNNGLSPAYYT